MKAQIKVLPTHWAGVTAVQADTDLSFARHTHEQFGVGVMERGAHKSASGRGAVVARAGDLITVNPGEVHDGAPIGDGGRKWRMLYFDPSVIATALADIGEQPPVAAVEFSQPRLRHPALAEAIQRLFAQLCAPQANAHTADPQELMLRWVAQLLGVRAQPRLAASAGVRRAKARIDDDPAAPVGLGDLAAEADISPYQLLRAFTKITGLTPHAYVVQRRVDLARRLIARGLPLVQVAAQSGFADQSHMNRHFVRRYGASPGAFVIARR